MFSIKKSFVKCEICSLYEKPSCILETNCVDNLSDVEVVFVAENPGKCETEAKVPLIGQAGKIFRKPFNRYFKPFRYLITNTVLCLTLKPNGNTGNPDWEVTSFCRDNCFNIIELCKPELIFIMGSTAMRAFDIGRFGITKKDKRGNFFRWRNYDLFLTVHPSHMNYGGSYKEFKEDFLKARNFLVSKLINKRKITKEISYKDLLRSTFIINKIGGIF